MKALPECLECGEVLIGRDYRTEFCSDKHRIAWDHRTRKRGRHMYDIVMAGRYDRAANPDWIGELTRYASACRDSDIAKRQGRRSWSTSRRTALVYGREGDGL